MTQSLSTTLYPLVDPFVGGEGDDTLNVSKAVSGSATFKGNEGNDTLFFTATDTFTGAKATGAKGIDSISFNGALEAATVYGGASNDVLTFTEAVDNSLVQGGGLGDTSTDGADTMTFTLTLDKTTVQGNGGNDSIYIAENAESSKVGAGQGADILDQAANKTFVASTLAGGGGSDTVTLNTVRTSTVYGGSASDTSLDGADSITVQPLHFLKSYLQANAGNDSILIAGDCCAGW